MSLDYGQASSHVRTKAVVDGVFVNDPDIADPAVSLPGTLLTSDVTTTLAWRLSGRKTSKIKVKITFRKDDGAEVAGVYKAYGFVVVALSAAETALGATRQSIEKHPGVDDGTSAEPMIFDDIGPNDTFGLRLYDVTAALATRAFIRVEEVT